MHLPISDEYPDFESHWVEVGDHNVHLRRSIAPAPDDALPVVLVHGLAISSRHWMRAGRRLARNHDVIAPDLPGFGLTEGPRVALNVPEITTVLAACLHELGVERAIVAGVSYGCQIVLELAATEADLVAGAVLIAPTMNPKLGALTHVALLMADGPREPLRLMPLIAREYLEFGVPRALQTLNSALEHDVEDLARAIECPVLVIRGGRDPVVSDSWALRLTNTFSDGRLAIVEGAGHATNFNSPDRVCELIERFATEL